MQLTQLFAYINSMVFLTACFHFFYKTNTDSGQLKSDAKILRFCYNKICDLQYFNSTLEQLLEKPFDLEWLDLSFNDISTIDEVTMFI